MDGGALKAFEVVPYEPWHMRAVGQQYLGAFLSGSEIPEQVAAQGACWTALRHGRPVACAGFRDIWEGRAETWAILSPDAVPVALRLTRAVRRALLLHPAERIEATVVAGFAPGLRWVEALGFEPEGVRKRYHQGRDHLAFVLLKPAREAAGV
jgi:hypothetical protein